MKIMNDDHPLDDDISVELANYTEPTLESALMIRRTLNKKSSEGFSKEKFLKQFPKPRKLDIGCGAIAEAGWIRLDLCERFKPDLLMDAHNLMIPDGCIKVARMNYVLGYTYDPCKVLSEIWRVLVPNGLLTLTNGSPSSDIQLMPGVKHAFPKEFWSEVVKESPFLYVPEGAEGYWSLDLQLN
jgi:SAM-dependent methyltransferase